ncbi:MAG TPA: TIM barrel protein [Blastocatellia bacterium]|nr:TIM barrel protein [Blastocatellia bacterium]HMV82317.1 TIM barrel protein [Blastocatellia bacterium]HMY73097.1 TIM barrel protein [Blastocatellia bacterium]HMZ21327.1 TIM barrel protein [Blastocatellia bacterium]HNG30729.1 TIM barrel protein [Blastocatellia bacterium]
MKKVRQIAVVALLLVSLTPGFAQAQQAGKNILSKESLAVQLWSFREDFKKDVPGTLKRVRELGFRNVELAGYYGLTAHQFRIELDKAGLKAVSMHIEYETARDKIEEVIREAKVLGVREVGVPWINSPFTKNDCLPAIEVFNRAGEKLSAAGLRFFYHLHGYEFVPNEGEQGTLFDLMMARTNPRFVGFQLDTYHAAYPGQDPARLLQKYPGRFLSLHLKDIRRGVAGDNSGEFREEDAVPMGQGKINWREVLKASRKEGIRRYIIEDETAAVWQNIRQSLKYLESLSD